MRKAIVLLMALSVPYVAGMAASQEKDAAKKDTNLVETRFDLKRCPFTLKDKPGYTHIIVDGDYANYAYVDDRRTAGGISITFRCNEKPAREFCPEYTKAVDDNESNQQFLRDIRVVRYEQINDALFGVASAANFSGVPRPRGRNLSWCIGDDHRALSGYSIVGTEKREYTDRILKILRTIRFVDSLDPEHSDSQGSPAPNDNIP